MKERGRKLLILLLSMIVLVCAGYLIWYYGSALQAEESNEKAKEVAVKEEVVTDTEEPEAPVEIPVDFAALQAINPDVYAWIKIDGTVIDYPVVQSSEEDNFYLDHTWEGK